MRTFGVYGNSSGRLIGMVRDHGERVECIGVERWIYDLALSVIGAYWGNETNKERAPWQMVRDIFSNSPSIR